jgi:hypothetical protein
MVKTTRGFVKFIYHFGIARTVTFSINEALYEFMNKTKGRVGSEIEEGRLEKERPEGS